MLRQLVRVRSPLLAAGAVAMHHRIACEPVSSPVADSSLLKELSELKLENKLLTDQLSKQQEPSAPLHRIVITGGPCAGKTTAMTTLRERLENAGWRVFVVPEAATLLFHNGANFKDFLPRGEPGIVDFQTQLAHLQMQLERIMEGMARASGVKAVLLCDRGVIDGKAYCTPEQWALVLDQLGVTESAVRDRRYDAVVHLVTAAQGAEKYYTLAQGKEGEPTARTETVEEAVDQDNRTVQAWVGSAHLYVIDNEQGGGFSRKVDRAVDRVFKIVGEPVTGHALRKLQLPKHMTAEEIVEAANKGGISNVGVFRNSTTYVNSKDRIRKRSGMDLHGASYTFQTFHKRGGRLRRVRERQIDSSDYMQRFREAQKLGNKTVEKELVCFHYKGVIYNINSFVSPKKMTILEVEAESTDAPIEVPPFLLQEGGHVQDVTMDEKFETRTLATEK